jgi:Caspase domain
MRRAFTGPCFHRTGASNTVAARQWEPRYFATIYANPILARTDASYRGRMSAQGRRPRRRPMANQGRLPDRWLSRAVLLGVSVYRSAMLENVPAAANNVHQLQDVLTGDHGGFVSDHCKVVLNWDDPGRIGAVLEASAQEAQDVFLVYFAGHGLHGPGQEGLDLFLALPDTDPGLPGYTALSLTAIRQTFSKSSAAVKILILDCCYSGLAIGKPLSGQALAGLERLAIKGVAILASSGPYEPSRTRDGSPFTAFTAALVTVLRGGIPGAGPLLKFSDAAHQVQRNLIRDGFPAPRQLALGDASLLALVRNRCADRGGAPRESGVESPHRAGIEAARKGAAPAGEGAAPAGEGAAPAGEGAAPAGEGAAPAAVRVETDVPADLASSTDLLDRQIRSFGPDHPATLASRCTHAERTAQAGDTAKAITLLRGLVEDAQRILGPLDPGTLRYRLAFGRLMSAQADANAVAVVQMLTELERDMAAVQGQHAPETRACRSLRNSRDLRRRETEQVLRDAARA